MNDWFDGHNLLPIERVVFSSSVVTIGTFRCPAEAAYFRNSGPPANHVFAFPRTVVALRYAGKPAFIGGPNVVTFFNRGQEYTREVAAGSRRDDSDWFALAPDILAEIVETDLSRDSDARPFPFEYAPSSGDVYTRQRALVERVVAGRGDALAVDEIAMHLLSSVLRSRSASTPRRPIPPAARERVEHAKELLARDLGRPLSIRDVAAETQTSVFYLCKIFRRATSFSLHQYRQHLRLRGALEEVASSRDLLDIACRFGFYGHSHFTAAFRSAFGVTPSQFRDDCRGRGGAARLQSVLPQPLPIASNGSRLSSSS